MVRFTMPLFMLLLTGAIALGHPAGATGVRQTVTLLHELARRQEEGDPVRDQTCGISLSAECAGAS